MRKRFLLSTTLLFLGTLSTSWAQEVYDHFQVDSVAVPVGGNQVFLKFIEVNKRMPYVAEAQRVKGRVVLSGVVETDGTLRDLRVQQSLHPACDREAMRVLTAYRAWQPAVKAGQKVPQRISLMVPFEASQPLLLEGTQLVRYFDKNGLPTAESEAVLKSTLPLDTLRDITAGDEVMYKKAGRSWTKVRTTPYHRESFVFSPLPFSSDSLAHTRSWVGTPDSPLGAVALLYPDGTLLGREFHSTENSYSVYYYPQGAVQAEYYKARTGQAQLNRWYPNGSPREERVMEDKKWLIWSQWDSLGYQHVTNGNGLGRTESPGETGPVAEEGTLTNGLKEGRWTGRYPDGKIFYEEMYQAGTLLSGTAYYTDGAVSYQDAPEQQPEFQGGSRTMYQFLASNLRYPSDAIRNGVGGKVLVSFVVCQDGSICDINANATLGYGLEEEAVRIIKKMDGKWQPGTLRGKVVRVKYNLPISFQMQ
ncbi:hypothetical protein GCM10027275_46070 [Rhabdobacter roseus]|uniref:TonB family protein n=1 Tax=Rhabdobacter roseus TaxID=1655419 RepID=A0A840TZK2_9BACT|nr:TonB family protein [Rhabdobacter roseus]MBB5286723.1 TonB family protein [Rhabdobacter roseus]